MQRLFLFAAFLWAVCAAAMAAPDECSGQVVDEQDEPMAGALIQAVGTQTSTITDFDGYFKIKIADGVKEISISTIGYKTLTIKAAADLGKIVLEPDAMVLQDVVITQSIGKTRETPVAMSMISSDDIDLKVGGQEFMEVLKTTPGVYTIRQGGGFGDAETRLRGFKSENVAMMVNGIPINDMEWGGVYQSNWAGLSDVASNIQTQRGLGATIVSTPSIGGTINITTRTIDVEKGGSVWYGMGNDGMNLYGVKVSTGLMKNGWAVTVLGTRKWGDGYIQGTPYNSYNYFVNISKSINDKHQLSLTAFGAPQWHDKRGSQDGLSIINYQKYAVDYMGTESPYKYNATFGYDLHGKVRSSNRNSYHKPQISLAHIWKIDRKSSLSTTAYVSLAKGGGYSGQGRGTWEGQSLSNASWYGASNGKINTLFRNPDGTFAYDEIQMMNIQSTTGSNMVMSQSNNSHNWYGIVSTYQNKFFDGKLNFLAGLDLRYYIGYHDNKIIDLYDGEYFMDDSSRKNVKPQNNAAAADPNWKYEKLGVGDVVYRNFEGRTGNEGVYAQGELSLLDKKLTLVLSGSVNNTSYQRIDHFYYDEAHAKSDVYNFLGGTVKAGANYNFDRHNSAFVNVGYISRAPFFASGVFLSQATSNAANPDPLNEKVFSAEVGYNFRSHYFSATVNAYFTKWMDKTTTRSGNIETGEHAGDRYYLNMADVDARHMGIEINATWAPTRWLEMTGMLSLGDYQWDSNAKGYYYNQLGQPLAALNGTLASGILAPDHAWGEVMQKGVKVGGSAQTTAALGATFRPFNGFRIGADWKVAANNYSDYTLSVPSANAVVELGNPWRIPWGNELSLNASYRFKIGGLNATLYGNVHNLFNYNYIVDARSNSAEDATWENIYGVFYSFGRTYSMKLRLNF